MQCRYSDLQNDLTNLFWQLFNANYNDFLSSILASSYEKINDDSEYIWVFHYHSHFNISSLCNKCRNSVRVWWLKICCILCCIMRSQMRWSLVLYIPVVYRRCWMGCISSSWHTGWYKQCISPRLHSRNRKRLRLPWARIKEGHYCALTSTSYVMPRMKSSRAVKPSILFVCMKFKTQLKPTLSLDIFRLSWKAIHVRFTIVSFGLQTNLSWIHSCECQSSNNCELNSQLWVWDNTHFYTYRKRGTDFLERYAGPGK